MRPRSARPRWSSTPPGPPMASIQVREQHSGSARKLHGGLSEVDPRRARPHRPAERPRSASHLVRREPLDWRRDENDLYAFHVTVPPRRVVNRRGLRRADERAGRRNVDALACDTQLESRAALPSGHRLARILREAVDRAAGRLASMRPRCAARSPPAIAIDFAVDAAQHARGLATRLGRYVSKLGPVARRLRLRAVRPSSPTRPKISTCLRKRRSMPTSAFLPRPSRCTVRAISTITTRC